MKRRSEYPDTNQWHLPNNQTQNGLITSDPGKNSQNFNHLKAQAQWNNGSGNLANNGIIGVSHSQSSAGVTPTSKRMQNQSVGQLSSVKQI